MIVFLSNLSILNALPKDPVMRCLGKSGQEYWDKDISRSFECRQAIGLVIGGVLEDRR